MSELKFKPDYANEPGDQPATEPTLDAAAPIASALRTGQSARSLRRRFSATRLLRADDSDFHLFRVY